VVLEVVVGDSKLDLSDRAQQRDFAEGFAAGWRIATRECRGFERLQDIAEREADTIAWLAMKAQLLEDQLEQAHAFGNEQEALRVVAEEEVAYLRQLLTDRGGDDETYVTAKIREWWQGLAPASRMRRITLTYVVDCVLKFTPAEAARTRGLGREVDAALRQLGFERERALEGGRRVFAWVLPVPSSKEPLRD
jgi:hypothetical protein